VEAVSGFRSGRFRTFFPDPVNGIQFFQRSDPDRIKMDRIRKHRVEVNIFKFILKNLFYSLVYSIYNSYVVLVDNSIYAHAGLIIKRIIHYAKQPAYSGIDNPIVTFKYNSILDKCTMKHCQCIMSSHIKQLRLLKHIFTLWGLCQLLGQIREPHPAN
jgi:hypothetical protein